MTRYSALRSDWLRCFLAESGKKNSRIYSSSATKKRPVRPVLGLCMTLLAVAWMLRLTRNLPSFDTLKVGCPAKFKRQ